MEEKEERADEVGLHVREGEELTNMAELMKRCRAFAGGVVVMVCPVLLALAPIAMLVSAGVTLITGIWPLLACCFSERFPSACARPPPVTWVLASLCTACLVVLACLIAHLIISRRTVISIGALFGVCILIRTALYCCAWNARHPERGNEEFQAKLDNSHEFLCGVTGILFLGLEGLALEGHMISNSQGIQHAPRVPMGIGFGACVLGVFLMFLEMIPPLAVTVANIALFTVILDGVMATGTVAVMVAIMIKLMGIQAMLLLAPLFLMLLEHTYRVAVDASSGDQDEESKPAPLELTKVTFTGFLAVSVPAISGGSRNQWADWFLLFAAASIVSGLSWRLLTHIKGRSMVEAANVASFFTHLCVAFATVPFTVMAWKTLS